MEAFQAIGILGMAVGHGLEQAEDDARRAWLPPGIVRQMREQYGLSHSSWESCPGSCAVWRRKRAGAPDHAGAP
jgi:hypothetical protein